MEKSKNNEDYDHIDGYVSIDVFYQKGYFIVFPSQIYASKYLSFH